MTKLHLGCGRLYLAGYTNIDHPPSEHTVQSGLKADRYCDIHALAYGAETVDEIRLHHVFEHFTRPIALAMLCKWRDWLRPGGLLRIETPDAMECFKLLSSPFLLYDHKQQVMRHLFGSHEAAWALHCDGWYKDKFEATLPAIGYEIVRFSRNRWGYLRNIEVLACKAARPMGAQEYAVAVRKILVASTIRVKTKKEVPEGSESVMLDVWMTDWERTFLQGSGSSR